MSTIAITTNCVDDIEDLHSMTQIPNFVIVNLRPLALGARALINFDVSRAAQPPHGLLQERAISRGERQ
jgi:hypothetical protein